MAYRAAGSRVSDPYYDDYPPPGARRAPPRDLEEEMYERAPRRGPPVREYETDIDIREREREPRVDRVPNFLRDDHRPHAEAGPMVLRSREVETMDRRRPPSPSPTRLRERINIERRRSPSPFERPMERPMERARTRIIERSPPPAQMPMERRPRFIERSPSPPQRLDVRAHSRHVERRRERSPTPEREHEHIRIIQRERERERERVPSPSPPPSPTPVPEPEVIRGPTIEREVITHYRDIDHGVERVKAPTPPPPPRTAPPRTRTPPPQTRETDIDIYTGHGETDIDIRRTRSRSRPREKSRPPRERPQPIPRPSYDDNELVVQTNSDRLRIADGHRRARSAAPPKLDYEEEAEYITSKIDSRGTMGEGWNGATKDWTIIDVPPGTERVKMDGVGGGGAEVTWQRYNGVRRAKFVPDREEAGTTVSEPIREREPVADRDRFSVQIYDSRDRSRDRSVVEDVRDTRISIRDRDRERRPAKRQQDMWTEITKDLVVREAIEKLGYEYEETEWFFYVMQYLRYEDVLELVNMSDTIRRERKERAREIEWERESRARWERKHRHHHPHFDDELIIERDREVVYDRPPPRRYR